MPIRSTWQVHAASTAFNTSSIIRDRKDGSFCQEWVPFGRISKVSPKNTARVRTSQQLSAAFGKQTRKKCNYHGSSFRKFHPHKTRTDPPPCFNASTDVTKMVLNLFHARNHRASPNQPSDSNPLTFQGGMSTRSCDARDPSPSFHPRSTTSPRTSYSSLWAMNVFVSGTYQRVASLNLCQKS